ncbi:MAG: hypothetical protein JXK94_09015 [Deltaproteobacteria bacterium]|nr:hypothetical protein [Deltaproteobacteria bacterium]
MKHRLFSCQLLCLAFFLVLSGCSGGEKETVPEVKEPTAVESEKPENTSRGLVDSGIECEEHKYSFPKGEWHTLSFSKRLDNFKEDGDFSCEIENERPCDGVEVGNLYCGVESTSYSEPQWILRTSIANEEEFVGYLKKNHLSSQIPVSIVGIPTEKGFNLTLVIDGGISLFDQKNNYASKMGALNNDEIMEKLGALPSIPGLDIYIEKEDFDREGFVANIDLDVFVADGTGSGCAVTVNATIDGAKTSRFIHPIIGVGGDVNVSGPWHSTECF